jgi:dipeptide/tripeptide permease
MSSIRLKEFPRTFWVANVMELFERASYYGLNSVLAVYLAGELKEGGLGFDEQSVGFLQGVVYAATYVVPILGGALADQYGYRRMLLVAFTLLASGYFLAGQSTAYLAIFLCLLVMACGAGLFKPIISGTIARTTDERTSALGFGIYYWMINLGATAAPLVVTVLRGIAWPLVFFASALYTGAMLIPALLLYRDPPRPAVTKKLREALAGAAEVLVDSRFMLMVVVYSGFWVLYFQNFGTVLWYLDDFVVKAPVDAAVNAALAFAGLDWKFALDAEHVTVVNGLTIILLQMVVSRIVRDRPALPVMMTGMSIGALGFVLLALSQNGWVLIAGVVVFSIGEMTAHPKYYSFIGLVAPAERKAVYMGYAFLYGVFGSLIGSNLGAIFYKAFLKPALGTDGAGSRAAVFWLGFAALDIVAALGLWWFARRFGTDTPATRARARAVMAGVYTLLAVLGAGFFVWALVSSPVNVKTVVQATLFLLLGGGGLAMTLRTPAPPPPAGPAAAP